MRDYARTLESWPPEADEAIFREAARRMGKRSGGARLNAGAKPALPLATCPRCKQRVSQTHVRVGSKSCPK
jgi:hypothetical protein